METLINGAMQTWAENNSWVMALFLTGSRANPAAVRNIYDPHEYYVVYKAGVKVSELMDSIDWESILSIKVLQAAILKKGRRLKYRIFLSDNSRIDLTVLDKEEMEKIREENSLLLLQYDREDLYRELPQVNDLSYRTGKPDAEEFQAWCQNFFADMTDVAINLLADEILPAQLAFSRARQSLYKLSLAAVASESSFRLNLGKDGSNLRAYMSEVEYDHLMRSFAASRPDRIWDALFQACMLFRKQGLKLNELEGLEYPKKLDVRMMKYFRKLWEENK